jgi:hypothetical protein
VLGEFVALGGEVLNAGCADMVGHAFDLGVGEAVDDRRRYHDSTIHPRSGELEPSDDDAMTATRLRELIAVRLAEHSTIEQVANTGTVLIDRLALNVVDRQGDVWCVHVLKDSRWAR